MKYSSTVGKKGGKKEGKREFIYEMGEKMSYFVDIPTSFIKSGRKEGKMLCCLKKDLPPLFPLRQSKFPSVLLFDNILLLRNTVVLYIIML